MLVFDMEKVTGGSYGLQYTLMLQPTRLNVKNLMIAVALSLVQSVLLCRRF